MKRPLLLTLAAYGLGCALTIGALPGADLQIKLDPAMAGAEFEGIGAVSAGAFEITPTLWAVAHITQFAEPGWRFLDSVSHKLPKGGSVVGFIAPNGKDISLVIETTEAKGDQTLTIRGAGGLPAGSLHVWRTDMMEQFIPHPDLVASDGTWTLTLNPNCTYSLTTTTGQRKGIASSPLSAPFPLPYREPVSSFPV